ncbi:hypothetical protein CJO75_24100 (plasmid) [Ralstonia solanacearum]|uniref:hypothetical protein n=1 Tax=Ralstonia pseudosolanacearum TaxID=1310165 RepID=UPI000E590A05|nr:hypothetical protein CJO75_24100 [Ralstonia solanacearum]AXW17461.1 hypothetical protein CJO84_24310 [Ralstonia solanacearum]AXW41338.1 hypothetical protein CJO89_24685 [Ralstonia solanacearum]AXW74134.1 hypothetical protein CJO96_23990 [Ralstonia solanacearum]
MYLTISANWGPESGLATLLILFLPAPTHFQTDPAGISGPTHSTRRKPPSKSPQYVLLNQWVRPFLEPVFEYLPRSRQQCVRLGEETWRHVCGGYVDAVRHAICNFFHHFHPIK